MVRAALIRNILGGLRAHSPGCQTRRDAWRLSLDEAAGIPGSRELDLVALDDGKTKVPGIKIHDTRLLRLMEALLHEGTQIHGWRTAEIHQRITTAFGLAQGAYSLTQLRYDIRKLKAHGLLERQGQRYCYRLTDKGVRVALMFVLFHKRVCGPLANSLFDRRPNQQQQPGSKIEAAYHKADAAIQHILDQLAVAA